MLTSILCLEARKTEYLNLGRDGKKHSGRMAKEKEKSKLSLFLDPLASWELLPPVNYSKHLRQAHY